MARTTPKDFFLWAGAMISLWGGVIAFIALLFDYINYTFPDVLAYTPNPYQGSMPYEMASLIVLAPLFLILMRAIRRDIARDPSRGEIWVRRWALFLTLFAAGATIAVDLIVLITTFLSGEELSVRFLLKVLVVLLVAGAGFMHFWADIRGYWAGQRERARYVNYATGVLVLLSIGAGFLIVGTPQSARQMRLDDQRISDLQNIQSQVTYFYQQKQTLPQNLRVLQGPLLGYTLPLDPVTGQEYEYRTTGALSFELCASFSAESSRGATAYYDGRPVSVHTGEQNWEHGAGQTCFERTIDPDFYPKSVPVR